LLHYRVEKHPVFPFLRNAADATLRGAHATSRAGFGDPAETSEKVREGESPSPARESRALPDVVLWPDTFNNCFHPDTAKPAVEVRPFRYRAVSLRVFESRYDIRALRIHVSSM